MRINIVSGLWIGCRRVAYLGKRRMLLLCNQQAFHQIHFIARRKASLGHGLSVFAGMGSFRCVLRDGLIPCLCVDKFN